MLNFSFSGAECVSKLLINGAQKAEKFMDSNTPKIIEKINPADRVRRVSPCVSSGIKIAKDVTAVTAGVTGFVGKASCRFVARILHTDSCAAC